MRVGIAGAGVLGRLLALELAAAGNEVEVFDPAASGEAPASGAAVGAAAWTAAGMLSPVAELECADARVFDLGLRSIQRWPGLVARLAQPPQLQLRGSLMLAHRGDQGAAQRVLDRLRHKAPPAVAPQPLSAEQLRRIEPALGGCAHAWLLPGEGQIDTEQAMLALVQAASALGVRWHWARPVQSLAPGTLHSAEGVHGFDWVFDVRGTGARAQLPVRGVRGEILCLHAPGLSLQRPLRLLHPRHRVYIVARSGQRVLVGASEIESEDRSPVSLRSTVELLSAAHSVLPELAEARIVSTAINLRPALPDNLPLLSQVDGLTRINGLFRHGWLIAPALVEQALSALNIAVIGEQP